MPVAVPETKEIKILDSQKEKFEKAGEARILFEDLVNSVLLTRESTELVDEILDILISSVVELIQASPQSLERLLNSHYLKENNFKLHVLIGAVVSYTTATCSSGELINLESLLNAVVSGLTAVESETLSLSGSSLVKLLQWNRRIVSQGLSAHADFVSILTADMCAMFSRIESSTDFGPFLRIVRFCELIIAMSDPESQLKNIIIKSVQEEFIERVYRTTLRTCLNSNIPLQWCAELLQVCHRGNELVIPLVDEVISQVHFNEHPSIQEDLLKIVCNERARLIPGVIKLLFSAQSSEEAIILSLPSSILGPNMICDNSMYAKTLSNALDSFERFRVPEHMKSQISSFTPFGKIIFERERSVLLNWLPYCLKIQSIYTDDVELKMSIDICTKLSSYLDL